MDLDVCGEVTDVSVVDSNGNGNRELCPLRIG